MEWTPRWIVFYTFGWILHPGTMMPFPTSESIPLIPSFPIFINQYAAPKGWGSEQRRMVNGSRLGTDYEFGTYRANDQYSDNFIQFRTSGICCYDSTGQLGIELKMQFTFLASLILPVWKALEEYDCDREDLFRQAGLNINMLRDPKARFPEKARARLVNLAVEATGDPCFGLTVANHWHPTTLHALGYSWMASDSLLDAFQRLIRYFRAISDAEYVQLEEQENSYRVILRVVDPRLPTIDAEVDSFFAVLLSLCRILYGDDINPLKLKFCHHKPVCANRFQEIFRAPIRFSSTEDAIYFEKKEVLKTLPTRNAELALVNDQVVIKYLAKFDMSHISAQVKGKILEQLPSGQVSQKSVAKALNLSIRSMQRRLKLEETSFKELLTETRQHLARQYIEQSQLSISEITFLLGFSEPSNFSRAFRNWNGQPPSEYRSSMN